jgi:hypothetical protein
MDINNIEKNTVDPSVIHGDYKFSDSYFENPTGIEYESRFLKREPLNNTSFYYGQYSIPLDGVKAQVFGAEADLISILGQIENSLKKIFVNSYLSTNLERAHERVCEEASKLTSYEISPYYISFDELRFAERYKSSACKSLIKEYMYAIGDSTYSYLYDIRSLIQLVLHELANIKYSLITDFGEEYEDESQQEIAVQYDSWGKISSYCASRIATTLSSSPGEISSSELDKISKKHAAQFQTFFAIRINAANAQLANLLSELTRDLHDNSDIFYKKFVSPSLRLKRDLMSPLDLDFKSTRFASDFPELSKELVIATNAIEGNFYSINSDMIERINEAKKEIDLVFQFINEKRKYSNFITQLAFKGVGKKQLLAQVEKDEFGSFFRSATADPQRTNTFKSDHGHLDNLLEDHHPQYLLKDGGTITGDISVQNAAKIDGVNLSSHAHTGTDGSQRIPASAIDYSTVRSNPAVRNQVATTPISLTIEAFNTTIVEGGIPSSDVTLAIEVQDTLGDEYEYEILFTEID